MSYILDALRKAERDRNLGRTPSLEDVTHAPIGAAAPARSRRVIALAALVVGLLVLAVIFWPAARDTAPAQPAMQGLAPVPAPAAPAAAPAEALAQASAATPDATETPIEESAAAESLDDLLDPSAEPADAPLPAPEPAPEPAALEQARSPIEEAPSPAPTLVEPAPAPAAEPVEAPRFKPLREMPADYRAAFANLRIDVHVYDADPARRWALIDGKKYLEGSTLPQGPRVAEITPEGIVFDFRGQTALFALNR